MKNEFIPYEQALALKELGFRETCFSFFTEEGDLYESEGWGYTYGKNVLGNEVAAPLYQQAFRWFRDKLTFRHNISIYIKWDKTDYTYEWVIENLYNIPYAQNGFDTYEEAEQACLDKLIEIVKNETTKD